MARIKHVRAHTLYRFDPSTSNASSKSISDDAVAQPPPPPQPQPQLQLQHSQSLVPAAAAAAAENVPPPASLEMMLSSNPLTASQQQKRSGQSLYSRAEAGDVDARLQMMSPDEVETELRARKLQDRANVSLWDYLNNPGGNVLPIQAASEILSASADKAENASIDAAYVWRWVQINSLWNTHPDPSMRSEKAFLANVGNGDIVRVMVVVGSSAQWTKKTHLDWIAKHWGEDWYDQIPVSIRPVESVKDLSKRITTYIAITCSNVPDIAEAIAGWQAAIDKRIDPIQRKPGTRQKKTSKLVLDDFKSYNESVNAYATGIKQDRLEMKPLVPAVPKSTLAVLNKRKLAVRHGTATSGEPEPKQQKQHGENSEAVVIESDDESGDSNDPGAEPSVIHQTGDHRLKKVRGHRIIEPVTPPRGSPAAGLSQLLDDIPLSSLDPEAPSSWQTNSDAAACDGPEFARLFAKFTEIYEYFEKHGTSSSHLVLNCCDSCRGFALQALACLKADLVPAVAGLEEVRQHRFSKREVIASQVRDRSTGQHPSHKRTSNRSLRVVHGSSDEDNEEITI